MESQQPTANTMRVEGAEQPQQEGQQKEVMRLRGGGNTVADCLA